MYKFCFGQQITTMKQFLLILFLAVAVTPLWAQSSGDIRGGGQTGITSPVPGDQPFNQLEVKIFPNPVQDKRFTVETGSHFIREIKLTNIAGIVVFQKKFQMQVQKHQVVLDNIPNGIYLLKITSDGNLSKTSKLLVRNQ